MTTTTGNITERAMLVDFSARIWSGSKSDKKVSDEVAVQHESDRRMGAFYKRLLNPQSLQEIHRAYASAYNENNRRTLPWLDSGTRVLSAAGYFDYIESMSGKMDSFNAAVEHFLSNYQQHIEEAKARLGQLFELSDYPSLEEVREKFDIGYNILPFPSAFDFRVNLGEATVQRVQADIEARTQQAVADAIGSVLERINTVVGHMSEKLRAYGTGSTFRESMITNVRELTEILPSLNITEDQRLADIISEMQSLNQFSSFDMRVDPAVRNNAADTADAILERVREFAL